MISAVLVATALAVLATYSLTGRGAAQSGLAGAFMLGFGVLAVSGAGLPAITLPWAFGMALATAAGLLLAAMVPARRGPFAAAVAMVVGLVMAAAIIRWLIPMAADLSSLNARVLALAAIAAAAVWAIGGTSTWLRTVFWLCVVTAALLLVAGIGLGAPSTLVAPLASPEINPLLGMGWLLLLVLFGLQHPAPPRSLPGIGLLAAALLLGLIGLLSLLGGSLVFPSTGLFTVAGYASYDSGLPGAILGVVAVVVASVGTGMAMRVALTAWKSFEVPFALLERPGWRITVVATLVGLLSFAPVPTAALVALPAIFGVMALIVDRRADADDGVRIVPARGSHLA